MVRQCAVVSSQVFLHLSSILRLAPIAERKGFLPPLPSKDVTLVHADTAAIPDPPEFFLLTVFLSLHPMPEMTYHTVGNLLMMRQFIDRNICCNEQSLVRRDFVFLQSNVFPTTPYFSCAPSSSTPYLLFNQSL